MADLSPTAILIPSLDRPQNLERLVENIHAATPEPHLILFAVSDLESMTILDDLDEWYLDDRDWEDRRYVTRMNRLISYIEDAQTIFFGSDDVVFHPGWLSRGLAAMEGQSVVVVNDLHNSAGTQALVRTSYLDRAVFDAPSLAFHPGYLHNFADNEMFYTASLRKELVYARDAVVEHLHPVFGGAASLPWDDTYLNSTKGWDHDAKLWRERREAIEKALG